MSWCKGEQFSSFLLEDSQGIKNYHASSYTSSGTDLCRMICPGGGDSIFQLVGRPWAVLVSWSFKLLIAPNSAEKVELPCRGLWVSSLVRHHSAAQHVLTSSDSPPAQVFLCRFKAVPASFMRLRLANWLPTLSWYRAGFQASLLGVPDCRRRARVGSTVFLSNFQLPSYLAAHRETATDRRSRNYYIRILCSVSSSVVLVVVVHPWSTRHSCGSWK